MRRFRLPFVRRPLSADHFEGLVLTALVGPGAHGYAVTARILVQGGFGGPSDGTGPARAAGPDLAGRAEPARPAPPARPLGPDLAEGTVYPVLHRLERFGLVHSWWADVGGRRRRVYELTGAGAAAVQEGVVPDRRWSLDLSRIGVA